MSLLWLKQKKTVDKLQVELLHTDDNYGNQYQQSINKGLNESSNIDLLEDRYNQFVNILTTSAQNT